MMADFVHSSSFVFMHFLGRFFAVIKANNRNVILIGDVNIFVLKHKLKINICFTLKTLLQIDNLSFQPATLVFHRN